MADIKPQTKKEKTPLNSQQKFAVVDCGLEKGWLEIRTPDNNPPLIEEIILAFDQAKFPKINIEDDEIFDKFLEQVKKVRLTIPPEEEEGVPVVELIF